MLLADVRLAWPFALFRPRMLGQANAYEERCIQMKELLRTGFDCSTGPSSVYTRTTRVTCQ